MVPPNLWLDILKWVGFNCGPSSSIVISSTIPHRRNHSPLPRHFIFCLCTVPPTEAHIHWEGNMKWTTASTLSQVWLLETHLTVGKLLCLTDHYQCAQKLLCLVSHTNWKTDLGALEVEMAGCFFEQAFQGSGAGPKRLLPWLCVFISLAKVRHCHIHRLKPLAHSFHSRLYFVGSEAFERSIQLRIHT